MLSTLRMQPARGAGPRCHVLIAPQDPPTPFPVGSVTLALKAPNGKQKYVVKTEELEGDVDLCDKWDVTHEVA
jgi:hypothetical protein